MGHKYTKKPAVIRLAQTSYDDLKQILLVYRDDGSVVKEVRIWPEVKYPDGGSYSLHAKTMQLVLAEAKSCRRHAIIEMFTTLSTTEVIESGS